MSRKLLLFVAVTASLAACGRSNFLAVPRVPSDRVAATSLRSALQADLTNYIATHTATEGVTASALSVSIPGEAPLNVRAGNGTGELWEIGSNTKAFTSVLLLRLEAAGKLSMDDSLGKWLPRYPAWKNVTIRQLLDMTSGIPTYDLQGAYILSRYARDPRYVFTIPQLVGLVYPKLTFAPGSGWEYSNTGYLLAELVIQKASGQSYASLVRHLFTEVGLRNTYYAEKRYPAAIRARVNPGYFFMPNSFGLLGRNTQNDTVSYARAGGGILSTPQDINRWIVALYAGKLLPAKQQRELLTCVGLDGKPSKSSGFGLGVGCADNSLYGRAHLYEGGMFGYRFVTAYFVKQRVAVAFTLNSAPDGGDAMKLVPTLYATLRAAGKVR